MSRPTLAVLTAAATAILALTGASAAQAHNCTCRAKSPVKHAVRHVRHAPTYARYEGDGGYEREVVRERVIYAPPPPPLVQRIYVPAPPPRVFVRRVYAGPVFRPAFRPLYGPPPVFRPVGFHRGWAPPPVYAYGGPRWGGPRYGEPGRGGPDWRHRW